MNSAAPVDHGRDDLQTEFRRVMSYVTERACVDGLEEEVMAALFDVLNENRDADAA